MMKQIYREDIFTGYHIRLKLAIGIYISFIPYITSDKFIPR
jgi:hypothetical protein